jgi:preprotein translocase subunit SecF
MPSFAAFGNDLYTGRRSIDFVGRRRLWYAIAAVAVLLSVAGLGIRGLNLGLEFRGGSEFRISKAASQSESLAVSTVAAAVPGAVAKVSKLGTDGLRIETPRLTQSQSEQVQAGLAKAFKVAEDKVSTSFVGPQWGQDVSNKALTSLLVFLVAVAIVIALYFRTRTMAVAAIVALIHDLILTVGVYAIVGFEVTPASVIGFLTILGYSLYDTVVVFDRVREQRRSVPPDQAWATTVNRAVLATVPRTVNTGLGALFVLVALAVLGGDSLRDFALALIIGILVGTWSSSFTASPALIALQRWNRQDSGARPGDGGPPAPARRPGHRGPGRSHEVDPYGQPDSRPDASGARL